MNATGRLGKREQVVDPTADDLGIRRRARTQQAGDRSAVTAGPTSAEKLPSSAWPISVRYREPAEIVSARSVSPFSAADA